MSYVADWLRAFERMRSTNLSMLNGYMARLASEQWVERLRQAAVAEEPGIDPAIGPAPEGVVAAAPATRESMLDKILRTIRLVGWTCQQKRVLRRAIARGATADTGVVALTTTRLPLSESTSVRRRLHALCRALPGTAQPDRISSEIDACRLILMFEPCAVSPVWSRRGEFWAEQVFIVDYAFAACCLLTAPVRAVRHLWRACVQPGVNIGRGPLKAAIFFDVAYRLLLEQLGSVRAFILHGNSFATEVLRATLIHSSSCTEICEVLHGVPTPEVDQYLSDLVASSGNARKHTFVPTLRELPLDVVYARPSGVDAAFAINPALNRYLLARQVDGPALLEWVYQEYQRLCTRQGEHPLIVTVTGANSHDREYVESDSFAVEQAILRYAEMELAKVGRPFALIYTPHPVPRWESFARLPIFTRHGVVLYRDTVFTWLVADLCIALHSSALFEAAFAGAKVFTPMRLDDGVYRARLLDLLSHPADGESSFSALGRFLRQHASPPAESIRVRIRERASRLWQLDSGAKWLEP
jgi:hypothetical protein